MGEVKKNPTTTDDISELIREVKPFFLWLNCERLKVIFLGIIASAIIIMFVLGIQRGIGLGRYQMTIGQGGTLIKIDTYTGKVWVERYSMILKEVEWIELSTYLRDGIRQASERSEASAKFNKETQERIEKLRGEAQEAQRKMLAPFTHEINREKSK